MLAQGFRVSLEFVIVEDSAVEQSSSRHSVGKHTEKGPVNCGFYLGPHHEGTSSVVFSPLWSLATSADTVLETFSTLVSDSSRLSLSLLSQLLIPFFYLPTLKFTIPRPLHGSRLSSVCLHRVSTISIFKC